MNNSNAKNQTTLIIRKLADGIDPVSGATFPADSVYTTPTVIKALHQALKSLNENANNFTSKAINSGLPWDEDLKNELKVKYKSGFSLKQLAKHFGRTQGAIDSQLERQNLKVSFFTKRLRQQHTSK